jgi:hypothetical protein
MDQAKTIAIQVDGIKEVIFKQPILGEQGDHVNPFQNKGERKLEPLISLMTPCQRFAKSLAYTIWLE